MHQHSLLYNMEECNLFWPNEIEDALEAAPEPVSWEDQAYETDSSSSDACHEDREAVPYLTDSIDETEDHQIPEHDSWED